MLPTDLSSYLRVDFHYQLPAVAYMLIRVCLFFKYYCLLNSFNTNPVASKPTQIPTAGRALCVEHLNSMSLKPALLSAGSLLTSQSSPLPKGSYCEQIVKRGMVGNHHFFCYATHCFQLPNP